jgi:periplasmic divalent cation tolerance protein
MTTLVVLTTVGQLADAHRLARAMVEQKLAACAHISEIESFYTWDGEVRNDREWRIQFKTRTALYAHLEEALRAMHPYKLPGILALRADHVSAEYAGWIDFNVLQMPATI